MTDLPDVKLRGLVNFPVSVTGRTGINVVKVNGQYYLDLDVSRLADATNIPAEQVDQYEFTIHNKILDSYVNIPFAIGATAGVAAIDGHTGLLDIGNGLTFTGDVLENTLVGVTPYTVPTIAALKALSPTLYPTGFLTDGPRGGPFVWRTGDYTAHVAADTYNGVYVKADGISASVGARVRLFDFVNYKSGYFGTVADHNTDNSAIINTIFPVADLTNTFTTPGRQGASHIWIEGGVKFSSTSLSFLPSGPHIFVYLHYFANSDYTKGVPDGGGGTNEEMELSVNSGHPGRPDTGGGMVGEKRFDAPLHPGLGINVAKQISGADAHFGVGQVRIPSAAGQVRSSFYMKDENVLRWRAVYEGYGDSSVPMTDYGTPYGTGVFLQTFHEIVSIDNVGSDGWPAVPAVGKIVTGVNSGAKGYVRNHSSASITMDWISGQFMPGEHVTDGVTTSPTVIGGSGVAYENPTFPFLGFGINNPVVTYGVFPSFAITGFDIGARLTVRLDTGFSGAAVHKEALTNAAILLTNTAGAVPTDGTQLVLNDDNDIVVVEGVDPGDGSAAKYKANGFAGKCTVTNAGGVSAKAWNIFSVTSVPTGHWDLVFKNDLGVTDYCVIAQRSNNADNFEITNKQTNSFRLTNRNSSDVLAALVGTADIVVVL